MASQQSRNKSGSGNNASSSKPSRVPLNTYATPFPAVNPLLPFSLLAYLSSLLTAKPNVLPQRLKAIYDPLSQTIWVKDSESVRLLWQQGFFGKGSLSRSEPTWWIREQNARGYGLRLTAEELTALRRVERKELKKQKAKEKLQAALDEEAGTPTGTPPPEPALAPDSEVAETDVAVAEVTETEPKQSTTPKPKQPFRQQSSNPGLPWSHTENLEHLQLELVEAFYLVFALGSLDLYLPSDTTTPLTIQQTYTLLLVPFLALTHAQNHQPLPSSILNLPDSIRNSITREDDFISRYVVYHHFRSLGWVVRSGIKFCTDFILYKGADGESGRGAGPPGGHAEFSVLIVKHYRDPKEATTGSKRLISGNGLDEEQVRMLESCSSDRETMSWKWLSTINRVTAGVKKTLILAYVSIPTASECPPEKLCTPDCISLYNVREVLIRRFVAARMRD